MVDDDVRGGEMDDDLYEDVPKQKLPRLERRAPAKPSDNLGQRRALAAHTFRNVPKVTSERLREHAEKHGVDQIAETAAEAGMDEEQLTNLIASLDRINSTFYRDPRKRHLYQKPVKTTPGYRARLLLGIEEEGDLTKDSQKAAADKGKIPGSPTEGMGRGQRSGASGGSPPGGEGEARPVRGGDRRGNGASERKGRVRRRRSV